MTVPYGLRSGYQREQRRRQLVEAAVAAATGEAYRRPCGRSMIGTSSTRSPSCGDTLLTGFGAAGGADIVVRVDRRDGAGRRALNRPVGRAIQTTNGAVCCPSVARRLRARPAA